MKEFIDKLIGRLEEELGNVNFEKATKEVNEPFHDGLAYAYGYSISIVNQLAEEYNNDFCEWKSEKDMFIQNPHTGRMFSNEPSMKNIYCNTCGKKIKIAPYQPKGENEIYRAKSVDGVYQEYNGDWK